jgi:hypothetical protein
MSREAVGADRTLAHRGDTELDTAAIRKLYDAG